MSLGHRLAVIERDEARREVERLTAEIAALRERLDVLDLTENDEQRPAPEGARR